MKTVVWIPVSLALALTLSNCGNSGGSGGTQANTGPFDRNGNYVEEWADNPSKWRKHGGSPSPHETQSDELPLIASNDQPPQNSVPLPPSNVSKPTPIRTPSRVEPSPRITTNSKPTPTVVKVTSEPRPKAKTKPKPAIAKAKTKPKPKATRYVVKKGDSLSAIASRNGSSVSAIQRANGISGTMIRPGQSLSIPKR